jgi:ADP-ribose pyrophosphatase YjhB (NUDIX family)
MDDGPGTRAGTATFLINGLGQVLIACRAKPGPGCGEWSVPGGRIERGESWQQASVREIREETGLWAGGLRLIAVTCTDGETKGWLTVWSAAAWHTGELRPDAREISAARWLRPEHLDQVRLWPEHWVPLLHETGGLQGLAAALAT